MYDHTAKETEAKTTVRIQEGEDVDGCKKERKAERCPGYDEAAFASKRRDVRGGKENMRVGGDGKVEIALERREVVRGWMMLKGRRTRSGAEWEKDERN